MSADAAGPVEAVLAYPKTIERCLRDLMESPVSNRCVLCGHVKHNELGYCQTGQCPCANGTTIGNCASIIKRDLPALAPLFAEHGAAERRAGAVSALRSAAYDAPDQLGHQPDVSTLIRWLNRRAAALGDRAVES